MVRLGYSIMAAFNVFLMLTPPHAGFEWMEAVNGAVAVFCGLRALSPSGDEP